MPRPGGHAKYPRLVAAAVDQPLKQRLDDWAAHQACTTSQLIRDLIAHHIPDLRKLPRRRGPSDPTTERE
jgi:hypothetical protein